MGLYQIVQGVLKDSDSTINFKTFNNLSNPVRINFIEKLTHKFYKTVEKIIL